MPPSCDRVLNQPWPLHMLDGDRGIRFNAEITIAHRSTMPRRSAERAESVTRGTRNVFADLGFNDAAERQARLRLAYALNRELEARKLSSASAAKLLGITQSKVSRCATTSWRASRLGD